jgi:VWFA-related protein
MRLRPRAVLQSAVVALAVLATPGLPRAQETPSFPATTEVVTVDVVVTDRSGAPVRGLRQEDFAVSEDGTRQEISAFEAVDRPPAASAAAATGPAATVVHASANTGRAAGEGRAFVVVFDELHLGPAEAQRARAAVAEFLKKGVDDRDRVTVVGTAEGTSWTARVAEGRETLLAALGRLQGRSIGEVVKDAMTDYEALRIDRDRDPLVTDRVMRRFLATGQIHQETRLRGDAPDRGENLESYRDEVRARAAQVYARSSRRDEQTLGILERSLLSLAPVRGRKSVVLVSGGFVNDTHIPSSRRVVDAARRANAAVYFVDARGLMSLGSVQTAEASAPTDVNDLGSTLTEMREQSEGSEGIASDTGGFSIRNDNDLASGVSRLGKESESYYLLGYSATNKKADGRFRQIAVKVAREGIVVRARRGYYAPGGKPEAKAPEPRDAALQRALDSPYDLAAVPLRTIALAFGEAAPGQSSVLLTTEADVRGLGFEEKGGVSRDTLELLLVVANRETGEFHRFDQQFDMSFKPETRARFSETWFPFTRELKLAPGGYQAKIVVRDKNSGKIGTLLHAFDVPSSAGLRVSSLVLSDRLREGDSAAGRTPELIARRTFAPSGILHCRFEVYGAKKDPATGQPNVTAGFSIRRSDGRFLTAVPESPLKPGPDGALARTQGTPLEGVPPGTYEMIVVVTDLAAGQAAEAREAFVIERGQ